MLERKECIYIYSCSLKEKSNYFNREKKGGPHIEGEVLVIWMWMILIKMLYIGIVMWFHIIQVCVNVWGIDNERFTLIYHVELGSDVSIMLYGRKSYRPLSILTFLFEFTKGA